MARRTQAICDREIEVVPFGVDANLFTPSGSPKANARLTIGTARTLKHRYGLDILIRAFADLLRRRPSQEAVLVIAGDGPELLALRALCEQLGLGGRVTFVGRVPHSEMPAFLNALDMFVMPSRYESFGVAALEACACEIAVIVSDAGGLPEVVVDGETGLVVEKESVQALGDALERLSDSADLRLKLGKAARQHVMTKYSWKSSVDEMEAVYSKLAQS